MNRQAVMERDLVLLGSMAVVRGYTAQPVFYKENEKCVIYVLKIKMN